jgi:hypothetical protein
LRGGFPEGDGLKISRLARSLIVCALEAGVFDEDVPGGLEVPCVAEAPDGLPGEFWAIDEWSVADIPGWLVGWPVGSGVGVESMSLINDYNSNFWCGCNLYANQICRRQRGTRLA